MHVQDLVTAILLALDNPRSRQQTFNICMDEPVDYGQVGRYLVESRGLRTVEIATPYYSMWLDNAKAKFLLGWRPEYDLKRMIDSDWEYKRAPDEPGSNGRSGLVNHFPAHHGQVDGQAKNIRRGNGVGIVVPDDQVGELARL